ncbi:hypothetical protein SDC9_141202 [bioreactor metagenome]|uniref:Uncharacterized protein n=1 Tax=bioreactor metagenome TaxID=1076179 RepID=A0A645DXR2_9ZZZZ
MDNADHFDCKPKFGQHVVLISRIVIINVLNLGRALHLIDFYSVISVIFEKIHTTEKSVV